MRKKKRARASISRVDRDDAPGLTDEHFERADAARGSCGAGARGASGPIRRGS
jgi:hypothetical protein